MNTVQSRTAAFDNASKAAALAMEEAASTRFFKGEQLDGLQAWAVASMHGGPSLRSSYRYRVWPHREGREVSQ